MSGSAITSLRWSGSSSADADSKSPTLSERIQNASELPILYSAGVFFFWKNFFSTLFRDPLGVTNISKIRDESFGELWKIIGIPTTADSPLNIFIPLQNNAKGLVLDLGPGNGSQLEHFNPESVMAIYGAEPSATLHGPLKEAVKAKGLGEKYHIISCGAERTSLVPALKDIGLLDDGQSGVFDTIVCSKVLCCVPNQEDTVAVLFELLKPGGTLVMCEHIRNRWETPKGSAISRAIQVTFTFLGWPFFLGGCHLNRNTAQVVEAVAKKDGGWESADIDYVVSWCSIPFAIGQFVKKL